MTEDQFLAWLLFVAPLLMFLGKPIVTETIFAFICFSIIPIGLFFVGENEFIKSCKKGYKDWEDSILPQFFYKKYKKEDKE